VPAKGYISLSFYAAPSPRYPLVSQSRRRVLRALIYMLVKWASDSRAQTKTGVKTYCLVLVGKYSMYPVKAHVR